MNIYEYRERCKTYIKQHAKKAICSGRECYILDAYVERISDMVKRSPGKHIYSEDTIHLLIKDFEKAVNEALYELNDIHEKGAKEYLVFRCRDDEIKMELE